MAQTVSLLALAPCPDPLPAPFGPDDRASLALRAARLEAGLTARELERIFVTGGPSSQAGRRRLLETGFRGGLAAPTFLHDQGDFSSASAFQLAVELIQGGAARLVALVDLPRATEGDGDSPRPSGLFGRLGRANESRPEPETIPVTARKALGITDEALAAHARRMAESHREGTWCLVLAETRWALTEGLTPLLTLKTFATAKAETPALTALAELKAANKWKDFSGRTAAWPGLPAERFLVNQARARSRAFGKDQLGLEGPLGFFDETAAGSPAVAGSFLARLAGRMGKIPPPGGLVVADETPGRSGMAAFLLPHGPVKGAKPPPVSKARSEELLIDGDNPALRDMAARAISKGLPVRHRHFDGGAAALTTALGPKGGPGHRAESVTGPEDPVERLLLLSPEPKAGRPRKIGLVAMAETKPGEAGDLLLGEGLSDARCDGPVGSGPRVHRWALPGRPALWEALGAPDVLTAVAKRLAYPMVNAKAPVAIAMISAMIHEACFLIQEGVAPESIEKEMAFLALGPLDLFDRIGPRRLLDRLRDHWGDPVLSSPFLDLAEKRGWKALGQPHAAGFFIHTPAGAKLANPETAILVSDCLGTFPAPSRPVAAHVWRLRLMAAAHREAKEAVAAGLLSGGDADLLSIHALGLPETGGGLFAWWAKQDPALAAEAASLVQHRRTAPAKVKAGRDHGRAPVPAPRRRAK